ncbi:beta-lactamase/transpeptidase-like protein [Podospora didyma]|uniref:Beta-lactamase/transpeptidase-like protein n=1 Tax=Podospora didyma TaxID=330526 RepID=A0AAE0P8B3_9PEZI|nr:beta-lactamase/transpeptidase-like protein [Podospora didyma]
MEHRLRGRIPIIRKIRSITHQPGISVGVIYHGRAVLRHNSGVLDVGRAQIPPSSETVYCVGSLTMAFMTASIDLLVQDKKLSWDSSVKYIIPEFDRSDACASMTVRDICSHRTGLAGLDEIIHGLDGRILVAKKDVVKVCNALPAKHEFRTQFCYNNALYALAGTIVERVSGLATWGDFQRHYIFQPLQMTGTTATRPFHQHDRNMATPHIVLADGNPFRIVQTELSADSMNGGAGRYILASRQPPHGGGGRAVRHPVLQLDSFVFTRTTIGNADSPLDGDYCLGWCYHHTPAKLGLVSPNRALASPTLGKDSPSIPIYGHQGHVPGYACSWYLIPDTEAAVIVLSNGTGHSDATDWIAQGLIQTMCDLLPAIDFLAVADMATRRYLDHYSRGFNAPLDASRRLDTVMPLVSDFCGSYAMKNLEDIVTVEPMTVNKQPSQGWEMFHYHFDVFCHLPMNLDHCLVRGLCRSSWSSFLISFTRSSEGAIDGLVWKLDDIDVRFFRVLDRGGPNRSWWGTVFD